jgi:hypothetical protein
VLVVAPQTNPPDLPPPKVYKIPIRGDLYSGTLYDNSELWLKALLSSSRPDSIEEDSLQADRSNQRQARLHTVGL